MSDLSSERLEEIWTLARALPTETVGSRCGRGNPVGWVYDRDDNDVTAFDLGTPIRVCMTLDTSDGAAIGCYIATLDPESVLSLVDEAKRRREEVAELRAMIEEALDDRPAAERLEYLRETWEEIARG